MRGRVTEKGNGNAIQFVTIEVRGDDDDYKGPFIGKTNEKGDYNIYIGPLDKVGKVEFTAKVIGGAGVKSEDEVDWTTSKDCHASNAIQVMEINWGRKP